MVAGRLLENLQTLFERCRARKRNLGDYEEKGEKAGAPGRGTIAAGPATGGVGHLQNIGRS